MALSSGLKVNAVKSAGLLTVLDCAICVGLGALANSVLTMTLAIEGFLVDLARAEVAANAMFGRKEIDLPGVTLHNDLHNGLGKSCMG